MTRNQEKRVKRVHTNYLEQVSFKAHLPGLGFPLVLGYVLGSGLGLALWFGLALGLGFS